MRSVCGRPSAAEAGAQHRDRRGSIEVVRQVLLARPDELHRPAAGLERDAHGLADEVDVEATAEAAAEIRDVDGDGVLGNVGDLRGDVARETRNLRRHPELDLAAGDACRAVDRLHRRVRKIRSAIDLLDVARRARVGGGDVAPGVEREPAVGRGRRARAPFELGDDRRAVEPARGALLPVDAERRGAALRVPPRAADDGERCGRAAVRAEADDAFDAGERERRRDVDRARAAAEHRAMADRREHEPGRTHVDAEDRRAVALRCGVDARRGGADQPPLLAPLHAHLAGRRRRGHARELAVVRAVAGRMADDAVADDDLAGRLLPRDRRRADQPRTRGRGGDAQHVPRIDDARRAAGDVDAELARDLGDDPLPGFRRRRLVAGLGLARMEIRNARHHRRHVAVEAVDGGGEQADACERNVELFGDEHGERGMRPLAHLAAVHRQHHGAVARDLDPAVEADLAVGDRKRVDRAEPVARRQESPADDERTGGADAAHEQRASLHAGSSAAAARIAARRRGYVPQRQTLPIAASISASLGRRFFASSAAAAISMPLWQ